MAASQCDVPSRAQLCGRNVMRSIGGARFHEHRRRARHGTSIGPQLALSIGAEFSGGRAGSHLRCRAGHALVSFRINPLGAQAPSARPSTTIGSASPRRRTWIRAARLGRSTFLVAPTEDDLRPEFGLTSSQVPIGDRVLPPFSATIALNSIGQISRAARFLGNQCPSITKKKRPERIKPLVDAVREATDYATRRIGERPIRPLPAAERIVVKADDPPTSSIKPVLVPSPQEPAQPSEPRPGGIQLRGRIPASTDPE